MTPKVLGLVRCCGECPNYGYYSGGISRCGLVDETVLDKEVVAPFCPLQDYPSRIIASMQTTILGLREPNKHGFALALLTHVATKLNLNLAPHGSGITIPFKDGKKDREVYLGFDYITNIDTHRCEITFMSSDSKVYKLSPDIATLWEKSNPDPEIDGWYQHRL